MEFGWINLFGAGIVVLIMIPNIIYAAREKQAETQTKVPDYLFACEQAGRYSCIVLITSPFSLPFLENSRILMACARDGVDSS